MQTISLFRMPALRALVIQVMATGLVVLAGAASTALDGAQMTLGAAALLQGSVAAALAWCARMARWWLFIHLLFFPVAFLFSFVAAPAWVYLALFAGSLGLYWQTFRSQVPYYPSSLPVWRTVADLLPSGQAVRFADLGSGFGGLVLHLSTLRSESRFFGIEWAPLPWLCSLVRARFRNSGADFLRADYEHVNLGQYDVVFAYLSPAAMPALWRKANAEMRPGSLLLSFEFAVPGVAPQITRIPCKNGPSLYGWRF